MCRCKPEYILVESNVCRPICIQGCIHGVCVKPNLCECNFGNLINLYYFGILIFHFFQGYIGSDCSLKCKVNNQFLKLTLKTKIYNNSAMATQIVCLLKTSITALNASTTLWDHSAANASHFLLAIRKTVELVLTVENTVIIIQTNALVRTCSKNHSQIGQPTQTFGMT
mgnify:CR=1 FL=1